MISQYYTSHYVAHLGKKKKERKKDDIIWYVHMQLQLYLVREASLATGDSREGQNRAALTETRCAHTSTPRFCFKNLAAI